MRTIVGLLGILTLTSTAAMVQKSPTMQPILPHHVARLASSAAANQASSTSNVARPSGRLALVQESSPVWKSTYRGYVAALPAPARPVSVAQPEAPAKSAHEPTPPGSFLAYRATSVEELKKELASNPAVRDRYAKHFGLSPQELDKFVSSDLQLIALKKPMTLDTWYIDRNGRKRLKRKLFPAGTMVFATMDGEPVFAWSCGNPFSTKIKVSPEKTQTSVQTKVEAAPVEVISTAIVAAAPAPAAVSVVPIESAPALSFVSAPAVSLPPLIGGISNLGWLGALGGVALVHTRGPQYNVPEPSSTAALMLALCLLPVLYRTRGREFVRAS